MGALMISSHSTYHGPDTVGHFDMFSLEIIIAEFRQHCPGILALLECLGNSSVDDDPSYQPSTHYMFDYVDEMLFQEEVQLMTSFMLLARATSKQVYMYVT